MSNIITVREDLIENINEIDPFDILTSSGIIYRHIAPDGRSYIGRTSRRYYDRVTHSPWISYNNCPKLMEAIKEFGWENFTHEILAYGITDPQHLADLEYYYIKQFDSVHNGYNTLSKDLFPPVQVQKWSFEISYDQLYQEYIIDGDSVSEIAERYDVTSSNIYYYIKKYNITPHSQGYRSKKVQSRLENSWSHIREERPCEICGEMFTPDRPTSKFCSRDCYGISRRKEEKEKSPYTNYEVSNHNRFHEGRYPNMECKICLELNPDLMTRELVDLKEAARKLGITRGELQGILKRKDLWFYNKHTPSDKLIASDLIVKTGKRSHRDNFLWDAERLRKIIKR